MFKVKALTITVLSIGALLLAGLTAQAEELSGTVNISSKTIAAGIGVTWGSGHLNFNGKEYDFKIDGLSVLDLGISGATAVGEVYNLKKVSDFEGKYASVEAGATLGGGAAGIAMKNSAGVVLKLHSSKQGVQLTLASGGIDIKLQ